MDSQRLCIGLLELLKLGIIENHREKFVFQCGDESDTTDYQTATKLTPPDLFDKAVLLIRRAAVESALMLRMATSASHHSTLTRLRRAISKSRLVLSFPDTTLRR